MTMQPNNKCTCPSGDGSLRWPCPVHPAASAHEAVAWMTRKALDRFAEHRAGNADAAASSYAYAMPDDDCFVPLYAAPVTAAPADDEEDAYVIDQMGKLLAEIAVIVNGPEPAGTRWSYHDLPAKVKALASTPAAPGIGLQAFRKVAMPLLCQMLCSHDAESVARKLHAALLDASPKGATFPNDGNSEAQFIADGERLNCPACGGSGHVEDSPKGGSEARAYTTGHCENHKKPGGCPLHNLQCGYPQCDRQPASDAEVKA